MHRRTVTATLALATLAGIALYRPATVAAAQRTVILDVDNMYCASCPYIVTEVLAAIEGVTNVAVSSETETATVTFDDAVTSVAALTAATAEAGYPSHEALP